MKRSHMEKQLILFAVEGRIQNNPISHLGIWGVTLSDHSSLKTRVMSYYQGLRSCRFLS